MTATVTVDIKSDSRYSVKRATIRERVVHVLSRHHIHQPVYVSVSIVGDRKMKALNKQYRNKDYSTDVLSFPTQDPSQQIDDQGFAHARELELVLGDIVIAYPQAVKIASQKNRYLDEIINDLVEHGLLHLMGIHHD